MSQHRFTMINKRNWAKEKMSKAVLNGNIEEAQKYNDIAHAYDRAASKYCK